MSSNSSVGNELFLKLKSHFPKIRLGDQGGMSTVDPRKAVFFDFDFTVAGKIISSISISLSDEGTMRIFYSNDTINDNDDIVKGEWFDFLKSMRVFAKKRLLSFEPKNIVKKNLDKRDFNFLSKKNKDQEMSESSLYGSTRSSYQKLENTKLIIRHSKKIDEAGINSRTRNIESVYVESANGERFRYPFIHLSGARAMQRHVANGGNPYDGFGQYIVSLSENIYNLRRFNQLVSRHAFLENTEILPIADAARIKVKSVKKTLESIQKQRGYETVKENFVAFDRTALSPEVLENLKSRFTIQQFNEELVDLFPYITDLLGEEQVTELGPKTLGNYVKGASQSRSSNSYYKGRAQDPSSHISKDSEDMVTRKEKNRGVGIGRAVDRLTKEAGPFVKGAPGKGQGKPSGDYDDSDAASEPIGSTFGKFKDKPRDESYDLMMALQATPIIKMEPFDKASIQKAIDGTHNQIRELEKAAKENPRDKQTQYGLEKASARLGLLQARAATAEPKATNNVTRNALTIEHLATHVKDDRISLLLSRISDDYPKMEKDEQREVNGLIKLMMSKVKYVPMFSNESTTFEEIENLLLKREDTEEEDDEKIDYVSEYSRLLDNITGDKSSLMSGDPEVQGNAIKSLNNLMSSHFPAGTNGVNAIESLKGIIDDPELSHKLKEIGKLDSNECVRPAVMEWIKENVPQVVDQIDTGDMVGGEQPPAEPPADPNVAAPAPADPNAAAAPAPAPAPADPNAPPPPEQAEEMEPGMQDGSNQIAEYVKSLYDRNTGKFPRGETGVLVSVDKKFGPNAVGHAKKMIEELKGTFDENLMRMRKLAGVS
jgi:hypothetical protein